MSEYEKPGGNGISRPGINQLEHPKNNPESSAFQALEEQFRDAIEAAGLLPPSTGFEAGGQLHDFDGIEAGKFDCQYWFRGETGGFEISDGRRWEWQAGWEKARLAWPNPQPLQSVIDAQDYPVDALPEIIQAAVQEVQAFTQAPTALVSCSALSALSIAGQAHVDVRRDNQLEGPVSLFMLTIADSGERKTTADGYFSKVIRKYEAEQAENKRPETQEYEAILASWQAKRAGIKDKIRQLSKKGQATSKQEQSLIEIETEKPTAPRIPRLIYSDTTSEELGHKLANGWPSGAIMSAEAGLVFGGHAMNSDSLMRTLGLYNVLWDGGTIQIDRRTSNSFTVKDARLTVGLQIQEAALQDFMRRGGDLARGIGFFARCLIAWPESTQGTRLFKKTPVNWPALAAFNRRMGEILNMPAPFDETGSLTPVLLDLSQEAKTLWIDFYNHIEGQQGKGGKLFNVRDIASKAADNAVRLAALFHLFEVGPYGGISREHFEGAARIAAWHLHEAQRFFGSQAVSDEQQQLAKLDVWLIAYCKQSGGQTIPTREVMRRGPNRFRTKDALSKATRELEGLNRIHLIKQERKTLIEINPALIGEAIQ